MDSVQIESKITVTSIPQSSRFWNFFFFQINWVNRKISAFEVWICILVATHMLTRNGVFSRENSNNNWIPSLYAIRWLFGAGPSQLAPLVNIHYTSIPRSILANDSWGGQKPRFGLVRDVLVSFKDAWKSRGRNQTSVLEFEKKKINKRGSRSTQN